MGDLTVKQVISDRKGKEIFEVTPVILGGSPVDPNNKVLLSREKHIEAVCYWNKLITQLREEKIAHK